MKLNILFIASLLTFSLFLQAQNEVRQLTELGPGPEDGFSEEAEIIGTVENSIIILDGKEVFISDGSTWGTKSLGELGFNGSVLHTRTVLDGKLYFISNPAFNYDLVEVDPEKGEMNFIIRDFEYMSNLITYKGSLYLEVEDLLFNEYFAKVDLETKSVSKIFDINSFGGMRDIAIHNDLIYTIHWPKDKPGAYLASNDGTPGSLNEFYYFYEGNDLSSIRTINMTSAGDNLFFWYNNGEDSYVLFVTDGTEQGTIELEEKFEKISFHDFDANRSIGTIGNNIFFLAEEENDFRSYLWMSDGTVGGTQRVDLVEGENFPRFFTNFNGKLYFRAAHTLGTFSDLYGLIMTDGTLEGTERAWDVNEHEELGHGEAWHLIEHQGQLFFDGNSNSHGSELFVSDGTLENTVRISDISPGAASGFTYNYRSAGDNLFFFGNTPESGIELYVYGSFTSSTTEHHQSISLSPNPADSYVIVDEKLNGENYKLFDINGRLVKKGSLESNVVEVDELIPGLYIIESVKDNQVFLAKFVKR